MDFDEATTSGFCAGDYTIIRTWIATDDCGNETIHVQTITVEDNEGPSFNESLPTNTTVGCDEIPSAETLTASDACGTASVDFDETTSSGLCAGNYMITRTWTATDDCGNETIHVQTITVEDNEGPSFNESLPTDATVDCDAIPSAATLTASDVCGIASVDFDETTTSGLCLGDYTITRTWTATDDCGNETIHVQTITVEDNEGPSFNESLPTNTTVGCDEIPSAETLTASDVCGSASVDFDEATTSGFCAGDYTITRTWTATDDCGNETIHVQTITVEDTTSPVWDDVPEDVIVNCSEAYQTAYENWLDSFSGTDACGTAIVLHDGPATISCPESVIVNFELTDDCGNSSVATATFTAEGTLNVSEVEANTIKMYPNPTQEFLNFKGLKPNSSIEIYNILGLIKFKGAIDNTKALHLDLNSGLYLVKIISGEKGITKKLIVR